METPKLRSLGWAVFSLVILVLFGLPVVMLAVTSLRTGFFNAEGAGWSFAAYPRVLSDPQMHVAAQNTAVISVIAPIIGTSLALFFAFVATRTRTRLKSLITPTMLFLFAMPALFLALSWGMLGTPGVGLLNVLADNLFGLGRDVVNIYSWPGLIGVISLKAMAFTYLLIIGPMRNLNRSLEEAAMVSGSGRIGTLLRVQIPMLTPALVGSLILNIVACIEAFDIPLIIGVPIGVPVVSTRLFGYMTDQSPPGYADATALAIMVIVLMIALVMLQWRLVAKRNYASITGRGFKAESWHLGRVQWFMTASAVLLFLIGCILPLTQLIQGSLSSYFGSTGDFTLQNFRTILNDDKSVSALTNSLLLAVVGGFVAMTLAVLVTYLLKRRPTFGKQLLELPTWTPIAMPGIILALAFIGVVIVVSPLSSLYGTTVLMLIALAVATTPIAARATEGNLLQISEELIEAAKLAGANTSTAVRTVVVPLIRGSFMYGWFIVGVAIAGNLQVPILLATTDNTTAAVLAYQYNTNGDVATAAAMFCVVIASYLLVAAAGGLVVLCWQFWLHSRRLPAARPVARQEIDFPGPEHRELHRIASDSRPGAVATLPRGE